VSRQGRGFTAAIAPAFVALALGLGAGAARAQPNLELEPLLEEIMANSPRLAAAAAERAARMARAEAAGSFPDPMVGVGLRNLPTSLSFTEDMMTMKEVMVRQRLPWPGKRALRREVLVTLAEAAEADERARRLLLAEAATTTYAELWLAVEGQKVLEQQRTALAKSVRLARARYEAMAAGVSDPLRAEMELARVDQPLAGLVEMEASARAMLAALLARPEQAVEGEPAALPEPPLPQAPAQLLAAMNGHPELEALRAQVRSRQVGARLAQREVFPDLDVGLVYGQRSGARDMVGAEVMVPLPVFGRGRRHQEAQAARAEATALERSAEDRLNALVAQVRSAHAAVLAADSVVKLYRDELLPRARHNVEAVGSAYQAGRVDLLTLIDAELQIHGQQLELLRARAARLRAVARLERAVGQRLPLGSPPD
jgi:outer membrane protein, heavy metal efflux system